MKLSIVTPLEVAVDREGVDYVRGEDATGSFGIQPGHLEFITVLETSVLHWRADGRTRFAAVARGVLTVRSGDVEVATRETEFGDDLETLERQVLAKFREAARRERHARQKARRMQVRLLHRIRRFVHGGRPPATADITDFGDRGSEP